MFYPPIGKFLSQEFFMRMAGLMVSGILCVTVLTVFSAPAQTAEMPNYSSLVYTGYDGKLVYIPDAKGNIIPDFSHAGYMGGGVPLPYVPVRETVWPVEGDNSAVIQAAIDRVSGLPLDEYGFRGAVLLKQGNYDLESPLRISSSGVVLRGEGQSEFGTVLTGIGTFDDMNLTDIRNNADLIDIEGEACWEEIAGSTQRIIDDYVPVGGRTFRVENADGYRPGDTVLVRRYGNEDWIREIGMDLENEQWRWSPFVIRYDRVITAVEGDKITVDAPITCAVDRQWGGGDIVKYSDTGRIFQVGIENLRGRSEFDVTKRTNEYGNFDKDPYYGEEYYSDENHYWNFIAIDNAKNVWVRNVTALNFASSTVHLNEGVKWATVQDCSTIEPISKRRGGRRFIYSVSGQLSLVQRCISDKGRHSFVLRGYTACGPNVFLDCEATQTYSSSEPHSQYVTGVLYDNVISPLTARFWKATGIGWSGANCVFWNCEGQFLIQKPPTAQNYAIGHIGIHATVFRRPVTQDSTKENGFIESWDRHVDPRSLYLKQLSDRLGTQAVQNIIR
jgi:hypothetical protein